MPIATFNRRDLPAGFSTDTGYFKIDRRDDAVSLLDMTCPHRGGPLTHGTCEGDRVVCPWHGGRIPLRRLAQRTFPTIKTTDQIMFIVDSAVARVFQSIPVDSTWSNCK